MMTKDEALKQALHELEGIPVYKKYGVRISNAITAIKEALAQPAQEPVAWAIVGDGKFGLYEIGRETETNLDASSYWTNRGYRRVPLYTTPPAAQPALKCTRSHPHENMDAMCELQTEIARLTNENARLKAQPAPVQESVAWKPIETAPKDGAMLLVCLPRQMNIVVRAWYNKLHNFWQTDYEGEGGITRPTYFHKGDLWHPIPPLYTTPQQRPWVGLTDEERNKCVNTPFVTDQWANIEAKLKEKNT